MDFEFDVTRQPDDSDNIDSTDPEELTDSDNTEMAKLLLMNSVKDLLFVDYEKLDKQNSRLTKKEIWKQTIMESTDTIIDVPLYYPITSNYRVLNISLLGKGRKEILEFGKTIMHPAINEYGEPENESMGFRQKVRQFFRRDYQ